MRLTPIDQWRMNFAFLSAKQTRIGGDGRLELLDFSWSCGLLRHASEESPEFGFGRILARNPPAFPSPRHLQREAEADKQNDGSLKWCPHVSVIERPTVLRRFAVSTSAMFCLGMSGRPLHVQLAMVQCTIP